MVKNSDELKKKIDRFKSIYLSKPETIVFEKNKFDIFIDKFCLKLSLLIKKIFIPLIMKISVFSKIFFRKILDNKNQKKLIEQINSQQLLLERTIKFNSELSEQLVSLNTKIDSLDISKNKEKRQKDNVFTQTNTSSDEILFFQKENLRLSNELYEKSKKFEIMKNEIEVFQNQRSNLIEKVNSINEVIENSNVMTNVFDNNLIQKKINIIDHNNTKKSENITDINDKVNEIFGKK